MPGNMVHEQQAALATAWQADAPRVAVLLPCYNEEAAIAQVVRAFREALPQAQVYVYDNASSDRTSVRSEEHTSELQSLMRISYAVFCLKNKNRVTRHK